MKVKFLEINQEQEWVKFVVDVDGKPYTKRMTVDFKPLLIVHENVKTEEETGEQTIETTEQVIPTKDHILLQIDTWYRQYLADLRGSPQIDKFNDKDLLNKTVGIDTEAILNKHK